MDIALNGADIIFRPLQIGIEFSVALRAFKFPASNPPKFLELFVEPLCVPLLYNHCEYRVVDPEVLRKHLQGLVWRKPFRQPHGSYSSQGAGADSSSSPCWAAEGCAQDATSNASSCRDELL